MTNENNNNRKTLTTAPSFSSLLGIAFIILKLCKVIAWPWVWVLAPIWIPWALVVAIIIFGVIFTLVG